MVTILREHRELAKVRNTFEGKEDHGILTCYITLEFGHGSIQSFGNLAHGEDDLSAFIKAICSLFNVDKLKDIHGRECFILRAWPNYSAEIEGLEVEGSRFTLTSFRNKFWPDLNNSPLEIRKGQIEREIERLTYQMKDLERALFAINIGYVDWDIEK